MSGCARSLKCPTQPVLKAWDTIRDQKNEVGHTQQDSTIRQSASAALLGCLDPSLFGSHVVHGQRPR